MLTFKQKQEQADYKTSGFDYMRILLAIAVVCWHSIVTSYGPAYQDWVQTTPWRMITAIILPMFFALSGFLVAGSLDRCKTIIKFLGLRVILIFPALCVEVFLSAFILGTLLTSLPLEDYFADKKFYSYLLNAVGHIHYELPGVFENNPKPNTVNGQLWTVPYELYCYISLSILAILGLHRKPRILLGATVLIAMLGLLLFCYKHGIDMERKPSNVPGFMLVICFLGGVVMSRYNQIIIWSKKIFFIALVSAMALLSFPVYGDFLSIVPICYVTVFLGLCNPKKLFLLQGADYSYGIFLYGYAIQQAIMSLNPSLHVWYLNLLIAIPSSLLMAIISWHLIEKPALSLRSYVTQAENKFLEIKVKIFKMSL